MSESIQVAENPTANPKDTQRSPKMLMATAALTMVTTLGASFIGIVPQLRGKDARIETLNQELNSARNTPKQNIHGTVMTEDGTQPRKGVQVYLLPEDHSQLTTDTNDSGVFDFRGIPAGVYSIIIRDSAEGKSGKGLLDEPGGEVRVMGAKIVYHRRP